MADNDGPFQKADDLSDLVLMVDGGELYVHKLMLMLHSPVFKRMFSSDFAEKDASRIALPGKKREDLVEFLKQIYSAYIYYPINDDNVMGVLSLADEYQVDHVTTKCRNFIERQTNKLVSLSVDQVLLYLGLCDRYHFDDVKGRLVQHVKNVVTAQDAAKSPFYNMVDAVLMRDIMQSKAGDRSSLEKASGSYGQQAKSSLTRSGNQQLNHARAVGRFSAFFDVDRTSSHTKHETSRLTNENQQLTNQIKLLTDENQQLKCEIDSWECRLHCLKSHRCSLFTLACQRLPKDTLNKCLVLFAIIVLLILTFKFFVHVSFSSGLVDSHGGGAAKALVHLPRYCDARTRSHSYRFLSMNGKTVVTSSGNLTSEGHVVLLTSGSMGVLDLQGPSRVSFPRPSCLEALDACGTGFTVSVTFRNLVKLEDLNNKGRLYILDTHRIHNPVSYTVNSTKNEYSIFDSTNTSTTTTPTTATNPTTTTNNIKTNSFIASLIDEKRASGLSLYVDEGGALVCLLWGKSQTLLTASANTAKNNTDNNTTRDAAGITKSDADIGNTTLDLNVRTTEKTKATTPHTTTASVAQYPEWKVETKRVDLTTTPGMWRQLHVSWHPTLGLMVWSGLELLGSSVTPSYVRIDVDATNDVAATVTPTGYTPETSRDSWKAGNNDGEFLSFGSVRNDPVSHLQVSGISAVDTFVTDILTGGMAEWLTTPQTTKKVIGESDPLTTQTPPVTNNVRKNSLFFIAVAGHQVLTTMGTMTTEGGVTLEPVPRGGMVLVLDTLRERVDLGYPLPCLADLTSCGRGFNIRITFQLTWVNEGHNVLFSSGGDQIDEEGVTLTCFKNELVFMVKVNNTAWMGIYSFPVSLGVWYTVDASWNGRGNGTLYINNQPVASRTYQVPGPTPRAGHPLVLGATRGREDSALMKVLELDFWEAEHDSVLTEDLKLPELPANENVTSTQPTATPSETTRKDSTEASNEAELTQSRVTGEDDSEKHDQIVVIVLSTLCALMAVAAIVGTVACWRNRRRSPKDIRSLISPQRPQQRLTPPPSHPTSVPDGYDYNYRNRPFAFNARSFSNHGLEMMY